MVHRDYGTVTSQEILYEFQRMDQMSTEQERKHVLQVRCGDCDVVLTDRGMRAVLLSDRSVNLISTDLFPSTVAFISGDHAAPACGCRVRETACRYCGCEVGYFVNAPCKLCLSQSNNGHHWMFRSASTFTNAIYVQLDAKLGDIPLLWGFIENSVSGEDVKDDCLLSVTIPSRFPLRVHRNGPCRVNAHTPDHPFVDKYQNHCR